MQAYVIHIFTLDSCGMTNFEIGRGITNRGANYAGLCNTYFYIRFLWYDKL